MYSLLLPTPASTAVRGCRGNNIQDVMLEILMEVKKAN